MKGVEKTAALLMQTGTLVSGLIIFSTLTLLAAVWDAEKTYLLGSALGCLFVVLLPTFLVRRYDIFQPLSFVILSVAIGVTLRTFYVIFSSSSRSEWLMLGNPPEFLLPASLLILVGLSLYVGGYALPLPRLSLRSFRIAKHDEWSERKLFAVVTVFTLISIGAMLKFLQLTGFSLGTLTDISMKRYIFLGTGKLGYTALGYLRWAASLNQPSFLLLFTWFATSKRKWRSIAGLCVMVVFIIAALFPFLVSERGALLFLIIASIMIWHYTRKSIALRQVVILVVFAFVFLSVMMSLRWREGNPWASISPQAIVDRVVGTRDFFDITTTAFVVDAVNKGVLELSYGSTYFTWLFAPIPRTVWPEKPAITIGVEITQKVFGWQGIGGPPPGMVGQAYWAFGLVGVMMIPLMLGGITGLIYRSLRPYLSTNKNMLLIYAWFFIPWAMSVVGGDWNNALVQAMERFLPLFFAMKLVTRRVSARSPGS